MERIEQEKEYIILLSIARYGYAAIPQDYNFLSRHAMLNIYYEILKSYTSGMSVEHLDRAVRQHAALQLGGMNDIGALCAYRKAKGNKETKRLLGNNTYYWKVLLNEIKKKKAMNTIRQIERMEKLHGLILREMTGDSLDLSIKLGVSRRMVNYYLQEFRDYGARIAYSSVRKTYYYLNDFEIIFKFEIKVSC